MPVAAHMRRAAAAVPLPPEWYVGDDGRSHNPAVAAAGGALRAARAVSPGEQLWEEPALLTVPGDSELSSGDAPQGLLRACAQLQRLNATLAQLRCDGGCVPLVLVVCQQEAGGGPPAWRAVSQRFASLAAGATKEELLPLLALSHAAKKVLPTEYHARVNPAELGRLLALWRRGAVPHSFGESYALEDAADLAAAARCGASLFPVASALRRAEIPSRANCRLRTAPAPAGGGTPRCCLIADAPIGAGDELVLPPFRYAARREGAPPHRDPARQQQHEQPRDQCGECCAEGPFPYGAPYSYAEFRAQGGSALRPPPQQLARKLGLPLSPAACLSPDNVPGRGGDGRVAFTLDAVFSPAECTQLQDLAFGSWDNTLRYRQMLKTGPEENYRLLCAGSDVHEAIWHRIRPFCPQQWRGWKARGLNDRVRFIQYDPGERFVAHTDGEYGISEGPRKGWRSFITVQVYLNGEGLAGGSTRFLNGDEKISDVRPCPGKVIVFEHCMRHTGEEVVGGMKRIIRTEIMFEPPEEGAAQDTACTSAPPQCSDSDGINLPKGYLAQPPVDPAAIQHPDR